MNCVCSRRWRNDSKCGFAIEDLPLRQLQSRAIGRICDLVGKHARVRRGAANAGPSQTWKLQNRAASLFRILCQALGFDSRHMRGVIHFSQLLRSLSSLFRRIDECEFWIRVAICVSNGFFCPIPCNRPSVPLRRRQAEPKPNGRWPTGVPRDKFIKTRKKTFSPEAKRGAQPQLGKLRGGPFT